MGHKFQYLRPGTDAIDIDAVFVCHAEIPIKKPIEVINIRNHRAGIDPTVFEHQTHIGHATATVAGLRILTARSIQMQLIQGFDRLGIIITEAHPMFCCAALQSIIVQRNGIFGGTNNDTAFPAGIPE